jgi:DNA/RNA-binding domain of Phe-tRNA-synthetase-like protein
MSPVHVHHIHLTDEVRGLVRLGVVVCGPVVVGPSSESLKTAIAETCAANATRYAGCEPADIPGLRPARELYRAFGVDPTRIRPSSEALLRRVLRNKPFPEISNAVDLCNWAAVRTLLPLGLYDADKISGDTLLRRGRERESYVGIGKESVHLHGRLVLVDAEGPFGNPTSDSLRTAVTAATHNLLLVVFAPASLPTAGLRAATEGIAKDMGFFLAPIEMTCQATVNILE